MNCSDKFSHIISLLLILTVFPSCWRRENKETLLTKYYEQSVIEAERRNYPAALNYINKAIGIAPSARLKAYKATLLGGLKHYKDSIALFEELINHPKTPPHVRADAMNNYAATLVEAGKQERAEIIWRQLSRDRDYLTPEVAHINLGLLSLNQAIALEKNKDDHIAYSTRLAQALKEFNSAIAINRDYVDALYYRAITLLKLGKKEEAYKSAISVITLEPLHEGALRLLDSAHASNGQFPQ